MLYSLCSQSVIYSHILYTFKVWLSTDKKTLLDSAMALNFASHRCSQGLFPWNKSLLGFASEPHHGVALEHRACAPSTCCAKEKRNMWIWCEYDMWIWNVNMNAVRNLMWKWFNIQLQMWCEYEMDLKIWLCLCEWLLNMLCKIWDANMMFMCNVTQNQPNKCQDSEHVVKVCWV